MIREQQLSSVLSDFARTLATDFPIQAILDNLVNRMVDVLPVTAVGVTLISPGAQPHYVAASSEAALGYEKLQTSLNQGPCIAAFESGESVSIPDLGKDTRFPQFRSAALKQGLAAVFTFPLRQVEGRLGALDVYRDSPGDLDARDLTAAQTLADVASAYLVNAQSRHAAHQATDRYRHSALHDALTGLPNRTLLQQRLEHAAQRARRTHADAAVLFADLDGFKQINDTYGHPVGDALLIAVARRMAATLRPGDTLARVSGDEFVILCEDLSAASDIEILVARLDDAFAEPYVVRSPDGDLVAVPISASVGMAFAGHAEAINRGLVEAADSAMYLAKRKGRGSRHMVDLVGPGRNVDHVGLRQDLRDALGNEQFSLSYQPIVRTSDGEVVGVEALLRLSRGGAGAVSAETMVSIAEQDSLILDIGTQVLQRGCLERQAWLRQWPERPLGLSVNVSARQLTERSFRDLVASVLDSTGMSPSSLTLEMTESVFLDDGPQALTALSDLRRLGVRLALDDFGSGYSSLNYLRRFPVDAIKIDKSFVADVGRDERADAIVGAVTDLAHKLGIEVVAEGVENVAQHEAIAAIGCDFAQGYYYARPQHINGIHALLDCAGGKGLYLSGEQGQLLNQRLRMRSGPRRESREARRT